MVGSPGKLVRYDWETGAPDKELPVQQGFGGLIAKGDELMLLDTDSAKPMLTRINLNTCDSRSEEFGGQAALEFAAAAGGRMGTLHPSQLAGFPSSATGSDATKPMDPAKVAEQAQHMSMPARVALPALLANTMNQQRLMAELNDQQGRKPPAEDSEAGGPSSSISLLPTKDGFIQFRTRLLESRIVEHVAMKAAPAKSALEGNVTAADSMQVANEILNEMQRSRVGTRCAKTSAGTGDIDRPGGKVMDW